MSGKAEEKSLILMQFGRLMAPAWELAERATPPSEQEYRILTAQFEPDLSKWENKVSSFATVGGFRFATEYNAIANSARTFYKFLRLTLLSEGQVADRQSRLRDAIKRVESAVMKCLDHIPIQWEPHLAATKTPFTTCMMIGDAISGARRRMDYFDRYLDPEFFQLYLRRLDRSVAVRLITTRGNAQFGIAAVQTLARLAAQEFASFSLVECTPADLHDRNFRVDDTVFHLGSSTSAAGRYPTNFNPADSTPNGHQVLDQIIASGTAVVL